MNALRWTTWALLAGSGAVLAATTACGDASGDGGSNFGPGAGGSGGSAAGSGANGGTGGGFIGAGGSGGGSGGIIQEAPPCDNASPDGDLDGDGYSVAQGDCNDCTPAMNPGAVDFPGNTIDDDCNGIPDDEPVGCDVNTVDIGYTDPMTAAAAIGLCKVAQGNSWGVVSARYAKADGSPGHNSVSHGILTSFGNAVTPREGARMLALSSGTARAPGDPGYQSPANADMGTTGFAPSGFPVPAPACPGVMPDSEANDSVALEVVVRVPSNANSLKYDFNFYTYEFPNFICSEFNDFFVALMNPAPPNAQNGNISFDSQGNPVSVNNGLLEVCEPQMAGGKQFGCSQGTSQLFGTGFDVSLIGTPEMHAATGWLVTQAPVPAGQEITLRFAIWDAGDHILDSTVLIDNFTWDVSEGDFPVTIPVPE